MEEFPNFEWYKGDLSAGVGKIGANFCKKFTSN